MTHHTDAERALASLRHLYQQMASGMVKDSAQAKRIAEGLLSPAIAKLEQAARRTPVAPVPQSEPVAYLWQHCETGRTRVVMPDMVVTADANWIVVGPLYLAAAPQPPEHTTPEHSKPMFGAAPKVGPIAWYVTGCSTMLDEHDAKAEAKRCGGTAKAVPLYAAPQPPEAAPVELPEPDGYIMDSLPNGRLEYKRGPLSQMDSICNSTMPVYEYGTVRQLLAAHGIGKDKA